MRPGKSLAIAALLTTFVLSLSTYAAAQASEHVIHTFTSLSQGFPASSFTADSHGNLFGINSGSVYELTPSGSGGYTYHFLCYLPDGRGVFASGKLAIDAAGNLYGSTWQGGPLSNGYVYEVSPPASGDKWAVNIIYNFNGTDGAQADTGLIIDAAGNLYGGTKNGGPYDEGVAFELSPGANGWTYTVLHEFSNSEGNGPQTALIFDKNGNLFGGNETSIFELSPSGNGTWTFSTAFAFTDATGFNPFGDPIFDAAGNLYETTQAGGAHGSGTAFMLSNSGGVWDATVIHTFNSRDTNDGYYPYGGLTLDAHGNLYGTTSGGGGTGNTGIVFELSPNSDGTWSETLLHRFGAVGSAGGNGPQYSLYLDLSADLIGTTDSGGDTACYPVGNGCGVIFKIVR
jgi:uncharacterized repeat protein (TIGR03803 family)